MKPSALIFNALSSLAFLKKTLFCRFLLPFCYPNFQPKVLYNLTFYPLVGTFPFDQFLVKEPAAKVQLFFL